MKKKNYFLKSVLVLLFLSLVITAEADTDKTAFRNDNFIKVDIISGKVVDELDQPLPGVSIKVQNKKGSTQSNLNGEFKIEAEIGDILVLTFIGFERKIIKIDKINMGVIRIQPTAESLNEVVVIGYGSVKKSDLTGSVASVKGDELIKSNGVSIESALQGRVSGVKITSNDGELGGGLSVNIRGTSTINGNSDPLYVIDGVPVMKSEMVSSIDRELPSLQPDPLAGLNPADIESIEILKDASATAIYGSRGSNGVVLITTKTGTTGDMQVSYNGTYGVSTLARKLDLLDGRGYYRFNYILDPNADLFTDPTNNFFINPDSIDSFDGGTDWQNAIYRNAPMSNHSLGFRGGNKNSKYYVSLGYLDQQGVMEASEFKRYTGLINLNNDQGKLKLGLNINFSHSDRDGSVSAAGGPNNSFAGAQTKTYIRRPLGTIFQVESDLPAGTLEDEEASENPYLFATTVTNIDKQSRISGNIDATYQFNRKFSITAKLGGNGVFSSGQKYFPKQTTLVGKKYNGRGSVNTTVSSRVLFENLLNYNIKFKKSDFSLLAGYTLEKGIRNVTSMSAHGFAYDNTGVFNMGLGTDLQVPVTNNIDNTLLSYIGRANYSFKNKILLTASLRSDASSKFSSTNKYSFFPSAAIAWKVEKENFMSKVSFVDELKLRYSIGTTGNQGIPSYQSLALLNDVTYSFGGGIQTGLVFGQLENQGLRWETSIQNNLGIDISMFSGRLNVTSDVFYKRSNDVLLSIPISGAVGVTGNPFQNIGDLENKGLELNLSTVNVQSNNFQWNTSFNISFIRNKIITLGENKSFTTSFGPKGSFSDINIYREGGIIGEFYGYKTNGIITSTEMLNTIPHSDNAIVGSYNIIDLNNDGIINSLDRTVIGDIQPDYFGGLTNSFNYKKFDFSFFFDFSMGQQVYNANNVLLSDTRNANTNKLGSILATSFSLPNIDANGNVISPGNPSGTTPAINAPVFDNPIDAFVEDASYVRLQNVTFGYNFPLRKLKISNIRAFVNLNNLFIISDYTGYDPDVNTNQGDGLIRGIDWGAHPRSITLLSGVKVTF